MLLKTSEAGVTSLTELDLLGSDETALSKAFGFVLAKEPAVFGRFLRLLDPGPVFRGAERLHRRARIEIERRRESGRTDIEILIPNRAHIIIECKVETGKVLGQQQQYLKDFDEACAKKIMCSLTQQVGSVVCSDTQVPFRHLSWWDVVAALDAKSLSGNRRVTEFLQFVQKNYRMKTLKEILIQDLSDATEVDRYMTHRLYRRDPVFGIPLYFAPYFTAKAMKRGLAGVEGIGFLSRVLGVVTFSPADGVPPSTLEQFTEDAALRARWSAGIGHETGKRTFYFLDNPVKLTKALRKVETKNSHGWIGCMIPKNRCVGFDEFVRQICKQGSALV